jgi:hypothetical protein
MNNPKPADLAPWDPKYTERAAEAVQEAEALSAFSVRQKSDIQWTVASLFWLGDSASARLQTSPWNALELRGNPHDLRHPWDQLSTEGQAKGHKNAFERFRANRRTFDYCGVAFEAILVADWPRAVCAALTAGNSSQGDFAVIGRVRQKSLTQPGSSKPLSPKVLARNAAIIRQAASMRTKNNALTASAIARKLAGKVVEDYPLPGDGMIRKILAHDKSWKEVSKVPSFRRALH